MPGIHSMIYNQISWFIIAKQSNMGKLKSNMKNHNMVDYEKIL